MAIWHICPNYWGHLLWEGHLLVSWDFARIKHRAHDELFQFRVLLFMSTTTKTNKLHLHSALPWLGEGACVFLLFNIKQSTLLIIKSSTWVFIAQLVELCSRGAEALERFLGLICNCLKIAITTIMYCVSAAHIIFISSSDPSLLILNRKKKM